MIAYDRSMTRTPPSSKRTSAANSTSTLSGERSDKISPALYSWLVDTLEQTGTAGPTAPGLQALQTEASFRQFYRVTGTSEPLVLMDSPPAKEQNPQFVAVAAAFAAQGIRVPSLLAHNIPEGWLLLTDLGQTHFIDAYKDGNEAQCLQAALVTLQRIGSVKDPIIPNYTAQRLSDELDIFVDWLVRDACDVALPDKLFEDTRKLLLANAANQPQVCVHRDFHCKNLLWDRNAQRNIRRDVRRNVQKNTQTEGASADPVGVLDFQDALIGPAGYDLASLLHDCYWKFSDPVIDTVVSGLPDTNRRAVDLLAVQRQLKAVGIFARLASRDSKTSHLPHIEPVLGNLVDLCQRYEELKPLSGWLTDSLVTPARRWVADIQK